MDFYIISHTHWDREWHKTFEEYRVRLVIFFDNLIELLEHNPHYPSFMMDGQTIVLEDYLAIKPHKKQQLQQLIAHKRIIVGPWYIQPDEFIPGGEFQIRNLLIGQRIAAAFGGSMQVGYLPDSFGQAAQLPQLLQGFGIDYAVFWRGITEDECPDVDFIWRSADGSSVKTTVLAEGYGNARLLNDDPDNNVSIIKNNLAALYARSDKRNMLLMCGFDQRNANPLLPEIVKQLNADLPEHNFRIGALTDYLAAVFKQGDKKVVEGEFRKGKYMRVHVSIGMTRLDIKITNYHTQTQLQRMVEPLMSMSALFGQPYQQELIGQACKYILQNHAHDSICCVCTDSTHAQMMQRYHNAQQISAMLLQDASEYIGDHIAYKTQGTPLVLFNFSGSTRSGYENVSFVTPAEDFTLIDSEGQPVDFAISAVSAINQNDAQIEIGQKNQDRLLYRYEMAIKVRFPGFGYQTLYMIPRSMPQSEAKGQPLFNENTATFTTDFFTLTVQQNGALTYTDRATGEQFADLNYFIENGNAGDEYDYSPPVSDRLCHPHHGLPDIEVLHNSSLSAAVRLIFNFAVPADTGADKRSDETLDQRIACILRISKDSRRVDFCTTLHNQARNHRVCVTFPDNQPGRRHFAEQQYGMLYRENSVPDPDAWQREGWEERYYALYPQQRYMGFEHASGKVLIFNKGLVNYEINSDGATPVVSVPLICTMDYMGKQDLVDRPGRRSGLHVPVPDSLMPGDHTLEYAFMYLPSSAGDIAAEADRWQLPLLATTPRGKRGSLADAMTLFAVESPHISVMAFKRCEKGPGFILRLVNQLAEKADDVQLRLNTTCFNHVRRATLNEQEIPGVVSFNALTGVIRVGRLQPNEIVTFIVDAF